MSDTSAIDQGDDEATKTTPDQPGVPQTQRAWQPPQGMPSPLGVLAKQFSQIFQPQPGPQPQPQPPKPPLDQKQLQAFARQEPYARPTGPFPPFRPGAVQTYVPSRPNRQPSEWGTAGAYPRLPTTWELPGMWSGIGQKLSQNGSGNVSPIARILMGLASNGAQSYVSGQEAQIKLTHQRAVEAAYELDRVQEEELKNARDSYAVFGGANWTGENTDENLPHVGKWWDVQRAIAARGNDTLLQAAIDTGDARRVDALWKERDATNKDLKASLIQQQKDQAQREAEQPYRKDGGASQAGPPMGAVRPAAPTTGDVVGPNGITLGEAPQAPPNPPQQTVPASTESADGGAGDETGAVDAETPSDGDRTPSGDPDGLTGDPGDGSDIARAQHLLSPEGGAAQPPVTKAAPSGDIPSPAAQPQEAVAPGPANRFQLPPGRQTATQAWQPTPSRALLNANNQGFDYRAIDEDAQDMVAGRKTRAEYKGNPVVGGLVEERAREINHELQRIRDSNLQGDGVVNAVHRVAPNIATDLKGIIDGAMALPSSSGMGGIRPYPMLLASFAHKARPNWAPYNYTNMAQFSNPNGRTQLTLTRAQTMGTAAQNLLTDINKLPDDPNRFQAQIDFYLKNGFAQDERYQRVFADWQAFAIESNVLRTGGTGSVTETEQMIKTLPLYGSKQQYRAVVQRDIDVAESNIAAKRALWGRFNAGNPSPPSMPGDYTEGDAIFGAIKRMNVTSGYIPGDVPASLQGAIPKQVTDAANWVRSNIMSPDPATRAKALQIQQWLTGEGQ